MNKTFISEIQVRRRIVDGSTITTIRIPPSALRDWCLALYLLFDELLSEFTFVEAGSDNRISVRTASETTCDANAAGTGFTVSLDRNSLDYLRAFFARYFRDGIAEVDHIDLQDDLRPSDDITFRVDEYRPPISASELRRRIEMP